MNHKDQIELQYCASEMVWHDLFVQLVEKLGYEIVVKEDRSHWEFFGSGIPANAAPRKLYLIEKKGVSDE